MLAVILVPWILLVSFVSCQVCRSGWFGLPCPAVCNSGWFGLQCQYRCRCASGSSCDRDGQCQNNKCDNGWFGPSCQYADLAYNRSLNEAAKLTDGDDNTCVPSWVKDSVTVTLNNTYPFSWLRVRLNNTRYLYNLTVTFNGISSCLKESTAVVDDKTLDIHCNLSERIQSVTLTGKGVQYLCSLYISGGRNVALKQRTTQSSNYIESGKVYTSNLAVDGNTDTRFYDGSSCSHTNNTPIPSTWTVTFPKPERVDRFVLFNRDNFNNFRLQNFTLTAFNENRSIVFSYGDTDPVARLMYTVISDKSVVSKVTIQANQSANILTLCEVEIYGDSYCRSKLFGRDCEHRCNCAGDEACFVSTGGCPSGCAVGYTGENCSIVCRNNTWGPGCMNPCNDKCAAPTPASKSSCNNVNGACTDGCKIGYKGIQCKEECDPDKYGQNCTFTCSPNCKSSGPRSCDKVDGTCLLGCTEGYTEHNCTLPCPPGFYGQGCAFSCNYCLVSNTTGESACDNVKGTCNYGCINGQTRPECSKDLNDGSSTPSDEVCFIVGICVPVIVAVVMTVVVAVFLIRHRRKSKSLKHVPDNPGNDYHQCNEIIGQGDAYDIPAMAAVNVNITPERTTTHQERSDDRYENIVPVIHSLQHKGIETEDNENDTPVYEELKDVKATDYNSL